jgi:purine-binding chemotaxis protein CheW
VSADALPLAQRAAELRRNFDRSFAEPPRDRLAAPLDLLTIRLDGKPYALRLAAVTGMFRGKKLTPLPQAAPEFLGIAGFRGSIVPVYDLRVLLGYAGGEAPRWLVVAGSRPLGLAFDGFDGHLRLPQEDIAQQERNDTERPHVRELARVAGLPRPIVDLASVLATIGERARRGDPTQRQERQP